MSKNPVKCHFQLLVCYVIPGEVSHSYAIPGEMSHNRYEYHRTAAGARFRWRPCSGERRAPCGKQQLTAVARPPQQLQLPAVATADHPSVRGNTMACPPTTGTAIPRANASTMMPTAPYFTLGIAPGDGDLMPLRFSGDRRTDADD